MLTPFIPPVPKAGTSSVLPRRTGSPSRWQPLTSVVVLDLGLPPSVPKALLVS